MEVFLGRRLNRNSDWLKDDTSPFIQIEDDTPPPEDPPKRKKKKLSKHIEEECDDCKTLKKQVEQLEARVKQLKAANEYLMEHLAMLKGYVKV